MASFPSATKTFVSCNFLIIIKVVKSRTPPFKYGGVSSHGCALLTYINTSVNCILISRRRQIPQYLPVTFILKPPGVQCQPHYLRFFCFCCFCFIWVFFHLFCFFFLLFFPPAQAKQAVRNWKMPMDRHCLGLHHNKKKHDPY